jgi:hypothetical protein
VFENISISLIHFMAEDIQRLLYWSLRQGICISILYGVVIPKFCVLLRLLKLHRLWSITWIMTVNDTLGNVWKVSPMAYFKISKQITQSAASRAENRTGDIQNTKEEC